MSYKKASDLIKNSNNLVAFTGAGISVESGIPTFRGKNGIWSKYDPKILDIDYFKNYPKQSWEKIKEIFYDYMRDVKPNNAHKFLAFLENKGLLKAVITQNIDGLHQAAGSKNVIEFHGTTKTVVCLGCGTKRSSSEIDLSHLPPLCQKCNSVLKPDFVFFKEPIPTDAYKKSYELMQKADLLLIIGTTGEIMPASEFPYICKGKVIEINPEPSKYTLSGKSDIFLQDKATVATDKLYRLICRD